MLGVRQPERTFHAFVDVEERARLRSVAPDLDRAAVTRIWPPRATRSSFPTAMPRARSRCGMGAIGEACVWWRGSIARFCGWSLPHPKRLHRASEGLDGSSAHLNRSQARYKKEDPARAGPDWVSRLEIQDGTRSRSRRLVTAAQARCPRPPPRGANAAVTGRHGSITIVRSGGAVRFRPDRLTRRPRRRGSASSLREIHRNTRDERCYVLEGRLELLAEIPRDAALCDRGQFRPGESHCAELSIHSDRAILV